MSDPSEPPDIARIHTPRSPHARHDHSDTLNSYEPRSQSNSRQPRRNVLSLFASAIVLCCFLASAITAASATVLPANTLSHEQRSATSNDALPLSVRSNGLAHDTDDTAGLNARSIDFDLGSLFDHQSYPALQRDDAAELIRKLLALRSSPAPVSQFLAHRDQGAQHLSSEHFHTYAKREDLSTGQKVGYGIIVPVLVILSGIFAGLTLGYMSLDETQLQVLSSTGTEKQREYARKIIPIRKDGHLLLTTLLIANMVSVDVAHTYSASRI